MYFLNSGEASLFAENGYSFFKFVEGDTFGQSEMFMDAQRSSNLEAKTECNMYQLSKDKITFILINFPHIR
jgi:CRP-like cAMP-binding protein